MNLGGAIPGLGPMAIYGPNRYTNIVMAEDEEGLPKGWAPLNETYWKSARGTNAVTVFGANSTINVGGGGAALTEQDVMSVLNRFAGVMKAPNSNYFSGGSYKEGAPGIVFLARGTAQGMASFGWTKEKIKEFLWKNSKMPWTEMKKVGFGSYLEPAGLARLGITEKERDDPFPITRRPENIMIAVAGGEQSGHSYYMGVGLGPNGATHAEIKLPKGWGNLLKQAEKDLGPLPAN
jgi:hypothetical protein